jgi:uncharacterized membrane protein YedE/YeeE
MRLLPAQLPWFVVGPLLGLTVVGLYALGNRAQGASGAYYQALQAVRGRATESWRVWYFGGLLGGCLVAIVLQGGPRIHAGYDFLLSFLPIGVAAAIVLVGGVAMGYGARWAQGCTSGHAITGISSRSLASLVAAGTFFATAIVLTFLIHFLTGGRV